jgi:hypothetical protein
MQFPHCDPRVLHAKNECEYCDKYPEWQELREAWGINFTGHAETKTEYGTPCLPCPSEVARSLDHINRWDGNVPFKDGKVNVEAPMFDGKTVLHNPVTRSVGVFQDKDPDPDCPDCHGTGTCDSGGATPWEEAIQTRCDCTYGESLNR